MLNLEMKYSLDGTKLTESFEGFSFSSYKDSAGIWTNGWGNTHGVIPYSVITYNQAVKDFERNLQNSVNDVNMLVKVNLNQQEFDALVDFDFNLGRGNLSKSTLLKLLNQGNYKEAANQFELWDKCNGKVVSGLLKRRISEQKEFNS